MQFPAILALFLIWQTCGLANPTFTATADLDDTKFSTRLVATPKNESENLITGNENPVDFARQLLFEFGLFNLMDNVVQAAHFKELGHNRLLFEMETPIQANNVVQACFRANGPFRVTQDTNDFFDTEATLRMDQQIVTLNGL